MKRSNLIWQTIVVTTSLLIGCCACRGTPVSEAPAGVTAAAAAATATSMPGPVLATPTSGLALADGCQPRAASQVLGAGRINDVAVSISGATAPDGELLAVAGHAGILLYRADTLEWVRTLGGAVHSATSIAFSPDGTTLASGMSDGAVILWDAAAGKQAQVLKGAKKMIRDLAFSPDGALLAGIEFDSAIVWDVASGKVVRIFGAGNAAVAFSPDSATLAVGNFDGKVSLWDVATGDQRGVLDDHTSVLGELAFSPDGSTLAAGFRDDTVILWDVATRAFVRQLANAVRGRRVRPSLAFSPDGTMLASGSVEGTATLWNPETGQRLHTLKADTGEYVTGAAFLRGGATLVTGTGDGGVALWDTTTGERAGELYAHTGSAVGVVFSPDGATLASAAGNATVHLRDGNSLSRGSGSATFILWDAATGRPREKHADPDHAAISATFSSDGSRLAFGTVDGAVLVWDVGSGELAHTLQGHAGRVFGLAFSPDGATLASGAEDGTAVLWDAGTGRALRALEGHHSWVTSLAFSPDGATLAAGTSEYDVVLWAVKAGERLHAIETRQKYVTDVAFAPDGRTLVAASFGISREYALHRGYLAFCDPETGTCERGIDVGLVSAVSFSPDGGTLALAKRGRVALLDVATLELVQELVGRPKTEFDSVALLADGRALAAGTEDGAVVLWRLDRSTAGGQEGCRALQESGPIVPPRPSPPSPPRPTPLPTPPAVDAEAPADRREFGSLAVHVSRQKNAGGDTIWLLAGDRPPRLLAEGEYPSLSPDGCSMLFSRAADNPYGSEYVMLDVPTSSERFVLSHYDRWGSLVYGRQWAPDSKHLVVTLGGDIKHLHWSDLWLVDAEDGAVRQLAGSGAGEPRYSPDGKWIATSARVLQGGGGTIIGLWNLEEESGGTLFDRVWRYSLMWAADSSGFMVALDDKGGAGFELWWVPVDGTLVKLGSLPDAWAVSWQPGARRVAWVLPESNDGSRRLLHLADRDGSGDVVVPGSEGLTIGAWSPDGRWLSARDDADGHSYLVDTERLDAPVALGVSHIDRWIDDRHYLTSAYHWSERYTNLYLCAAPASCGFLARLDGEIRDQSYTDVVCRPQE